MVLKLLKVQNKYRPFCLVLFCMLILLCLVLATVLQQNKLPRSFTETLAKADKVQLLDRHGKPLSISYQNSWNVHDIVPLYEIPEVLQQSFILAEDQRFFQHHGQDWQARFHALWQNVVSMRVVRGASTITEQVVRMLHPRPRTLWSRWLEGWEARSLEQRFSKLAILEFYLNQVPYAANRRGVQQAARYYFDRNLDTLSYKEMLALAVLVRAPSRLDLYKKPLALQQSISRLASNMADAHYFSRDEVRQFLNEPFVLQNPYLSILATHFVRYVLAQQSHQAHRQLLTTLDGYLQNTVQGILDQRLQALHKHHVKNAAMLVVDHHTSEILAWVIGGAGDKHRPAALIDAVTAYRQPGSALKPLLYAAAINKGWTAATIIDDAPLSESVGYGLHQYRNYSRVFYGSVSLREALANSLNIPALRTIQYVGSRAYITLLQQLGFARITQHPDFYGDGLALGNAEVSLLEMVQAYAVLANRGVMQPLRVVRENADNTGNSRIFSPEVSSLMGNILSDPDARHLEFGSATVLNLPVQTAVKTGTSSDFRDSWTVGYNDRYVVGVWMGNLDNSATDGITGSSGPGLVMRSVFAVLNQHRKTRPLYLSPRLIKQQICSDTGELITANNACVTRKMEYFIAGKTPELKLSPRNAQSIRIRQPTPGLHLAVDPRVPLPKQAFEFVVAGVRQGDRVDWLVNGELVGTGKKMRYLWNLQRGEHELQAKIYNNGLSVYQTPGIKYLVK